MQNVVALGIWLYVILPPRSYPFCQNQAFYRVVLNIFLESLQSNFHQLHEIFIYIPYTRLAAPL